MLASLLLATALMLKPAAPSVQLGQRGIDRWAADTYKTVELDKHYNPFPKQQLFHQDPHKYRLFGGAAGPGKSLSIIMELLMSAYEHEDGKEVTVLALRRTVPQLRKSLIPRFREKVPKELYKSFSQQSGICTLLNNATFQFGSMQFDQDVWNYQGGQNKRVGWDELTQFSYYQWSTLSAWNRCPIAPAGMDGATNPVGPGAQWVRNMFILGKPAPGMEADTYDKSEYGFIPALISDNPIYMNDPAYLATLKKLPKRMREALLSGRWDVAIGAFYDIWDPAVNTMPASEFSRETFWPVWLGIDWGFEHEAAIYWFTTAPNGKTYIYRELVINRTGPKALAERIIELSIGPDGNSEKPLEIHLSFDTFQKRTDDEPIATQMAEVFKKAGWPWPEPATRDKVGRELLFYEMLQTQNLVIIEPDGDTEQQDLGCPRLIEIIPTAPRDEKKIEQIADFLGNDPLDGAGYGLYGHIKRVHIPLAHRVAAKMQQKDKLLADAGLAPLTLTDRYRELLNVTAKERKNTIVKVPKRWRPGSR